MRVWLDLLDAFEDQVVVQVSESLYGVGIVAKLDELDAHGSLVECPNCLGVFELVIILTMWSLTKS
jgi:hypothetical protein